MLGSKKFLLEKCGSKIFGLKNIFDQRNCVKSFWSNKFGSKKFYLKNLLGPNVFWLKKNIGQFWPNFGSKTIWDHLFLLQKILKSKKDFGPEKFLIQKKLFGPKKILDQRIVAKKHFWSKFFFDENKICVKSFGSRTFFDQKVWV